MYGARQTETFLIDPDLAFRLEKVLFGSLAAALYYESDPPSGIAVQDHAWRISGEGKRYRVLRYRVSLETGHTLKFGDRTVDLSDLAEGADGLVLIEVEKRSRLASLFIAVRKKILHFFGKQNCVA